MEATFPLICHQTLSLLTLNLSNFGLNSMRACHFDSLPSIRKKTLNRSRYNIEYEVLLSATIHHYAYTKEKINIQFRMLPNCTNALGEPKRGKTLGHGNCQQPDNQFN